MIGVVGELLITAGVVALLFVGWQLWIGDAIIGSHQRAVAQQLSDQWDQALASTAPTDPASSSPPAAGVPTTAEPVIQPEAGDAETFGNMHIPRFGADYQVPIAGGVSRARTLDPIGFGHYPGTPMPGAVGNVAIAGHRGGNGAPLHRIADLHVGDAIVIETQDGWYTYRFRTLEYVWPTDVDVLLPVPQRTDVAANERYLTLTSCSPIDGSAERIIAYSTFDYFTPRAAGAPPSLTEAVT